MGSFPSGHTTYSIFCVVWLSFFLPRYRLILCILGSILPLALIILNYHFLGDCLAGIYLALNMGIISIKLYEVYLKNYKKCAFAKYSQST